MKIDITGGRQRFEIREEQALKDVVVDPNTWVMMDPPRFVAR